MNDDPQNPTEEPSAEERLLGLGLELHTADGESAFRDLPELAAGDQVGEYTILRKLGEGGMGVVYLAEQQAPVRRRVALKLIKLGMDTQQVVARFEAERQALALMDHPSIATVLQAGATEEGRPFFAMEYIDGERITDYCDRRKLPTQERLRLFQKVCSAIQHAHQRGIVHRDLKPGNVLVTDSEGEPLPKIIDFGVARALDQRLTERTLFTELGVLVGTPDYMSPEQTDVTGLTVDTRSDVYSLGVLLYELITGALPFDPRELREGAFEDLCRRIREDRPSRPSARLESLVSGDRSLADSRATSPNTLIRRLRGDLDWITMKALEKEKGRRYASPEEMSSDIGRHLRSEPIVARPPSASYLLRKLVDRNRTGAALSVLALVLLVGFGIWMAALYRMSQNNLTRALDAELKANQESETLRQVTSFVTGVFEVSDPSEAMGASITARELLDTAYLRIQSELTDQPEVRGRVLSTLSETYRNLGLYDRALPLSKEALDQLDSSLGADHPATRNSELQIAIAEHAVGQSNSAFARAEALLESLPGNSDSDRAEQREISMLMARILIERGDFDQAGTFARDAREGAIADLGATHLQSLRAAIVLSEVKRRQSDFAGAEAILLDALAALRGSPLALHPATLEAQYVLAQNYRAQGKFDQGEQEMKACLELHQKVLGDSHLNTIRVLDGLAAFHAQRQQFDQAEPLFREAIDRLQKAGHVRHPSLLTSRSNLALMLQQQGRYEESEALYAQNLPDQRALFGDEHPKTLRALGNMGNLYLEQGDYARAKALYLEALEGQLKVLGEEHVDTLRTLSNLGGAYSGLGDYGEAESVMVRTAAAQEKVLGADNPQLGITLHNLAVLRRDHTDRDQAAALFARVQEMWDARLGKSHPYCLANLSEHLKLLQLLEQDEAARELKAELDARSTAAAPG